MRRDSGNSGIVGRMKLNSILNTNKFPSDTPDRVMQYEVPHYVVVGTRAPVQPEPLRTYW
jgi:hypothetical protein